MPLHFSLRLVIPVLAGAVLLASCAEPAAPVIAPPPPAPVLPSVSLSPRLVEYAAAYRRYIAGAAAISPAFANGEAIATSVQAGAAYEPGQLVRGAIVYAAVVALQDKAFVDGVRIYARDPTQRRQIAYELLKDPAYAVGIQGSASAAGLVIAALGSDGQQLYDQGKAVKQAAYDIQKQPWSKADIQAREVRLAGAKSLSAAVMRGEVAETGRLQQASVGAVPLGVTGASAAPPYTTTVVRGLAIAALAALGEAGDANVESILGLTTEANIGGCMNSAKLNLYQCLAVARPHYEDVFCLGQHAMMDTGRCVIRSVGQPEPFEARFIPSQESIDKGMQTKKPPAKKARKKS